MSSSLTDLSFKTDTYNFMSAGSPENNKLSLIATVLILLLISLLIGYYITNLSNYSLKTTSDKKDVKELLQQTNDEIKQNRVNKK